MRISLDKKLESVNDISSNMLKRALQNSVIRYGRIFILVKPRKNQLRLATKWATSCNEHLSMAYWEDLFNIIESYAPIAEVMTKKPAIRFHILRGKDFWF